MAKASAVTSTGQSTPTKRRLKARSIPNDITLAVGQAIRARRQALGLTQLNLAMTAEIERTRVSKLELGLVNPSVLSLASVCHVLGMTLADLFAEIRLSHPPTTAGGGLRRANQAVLDKKPSVKVKPAVRSRSRR